jgi:hypothetical protein
MPRRDSAESVQRGNHHEAGRPQGWSIQAISIDQTWVGMWAGIELLPIL